MRPDSRPFAKKESTKTQSAHLGLLRAEREPSSRQRTVFGSAAKMGDFDPAIINAPLAWNDLVAAHPLLALVHDMDPVVGNPTFDNPTFALPFDIVHTPPLSPQPHGPTEDMDMDMDIEMASPVDTPPPTPLASPAPHPLWGDAAEWGEEEEWDFDMPAA
jgi:hypothetical protein